MLKFTKLLITFMLISIFIVSPVFATDTATSTSDLPKEENSTSLLTATTINDDLFVNDVKNSNYILDSILYGNAFISTNNLTITSKNKGGIIFGDLFASTVNTTIQSELVYSNTKDKSGNYIVDQVKSSSTINGNVFVVATDTFTLESKCEIRGDLYVCAQNINIAPDAIISGNVFAFANSTFTLNGKVSGSVYVNANTCNIGYTGYISKDLALTVHESANIAGKIDRTTKVASEKGKIVTTEDFITGKDLFVEADNFEFAGEVQGNAKMSTKSLGFNNTKTCIVRGNLDYATKSELTVPEGIVLGETTTSAYKDKTSFSYMLLSKLVTYISFLLYIFVIAFVFKYIAPNFVEKLSAITTTNIFVGLGVGFALLIALIPIFVLLILTNFTISLGFVLLLTVIFIAAIAIPLFILAIATAWKSEKINLYLRLLVIATILFLVNLIPSIGTTVTVLFTIVAVGKILIALFYKKK